MTRPPLYQGDIEDKILDFEEALDVETHRYGELCELLGEAEADYKLAVAQERIRLSALGRRMTVQEREDRALIHCDGLYRAFLLLQERERATKAALNSYEKRLDAFRTLAANVRNLTTT